MRGFPQDVIKGVMLVNIYNSLPLWSKAKKVIPDTSLGSGWERLVPEVCSQAVINQLDNATVFHI